MKQATCVGAASPSSAASTSFVPRTDRIRQVAVKLPQVITDLQQILCSDNVTYIDWGNVRNWSTKLGWHVCHKRLKQLIDSFCGPSAAKIYYGTLNGDPNSQAFITEAKRVGYEIHTKAVKSIRLPIDVSSISAESPDIIKNFVNPRLLSTLSVEMIRQLNEHLRDLNKKGTTHFEDLKCNFDVEIGRDILMDSTSGRFNCYSLWSGDSDFHDPVFELLRRGKRVVVFGTSRMISRQLNQLRTKGLQIYDIKKMKEFICWAKELPDEFKRP